MNHPRLMERKYTPCGDGRTRFFALGTMGRGETPAMSAVSPFLEASGSDADIGFRPFLRFPASQVQGMFHR
jgi:hypothetical protein